MKRIVGAFFLLALIVAVGCSPSDKSSYVRSLEERVSSQEAAIRNLNATIDEMKRSLELAKAKNERDEALIANLEKRIQELLKNRYQLEVDLENLIKSFQAAQLGETPKGDGKTTVTELGDGITLERPHDGRPAKLVIAGRVLFPSGEYKLTDTGKAALLKIATILRDQTGDSILRVDGHTDNVPVRQPNDKGIIDNEHLSALRAYSVYIFLVKDGKIPPKRIFFSGWGEHQPIADNKTEEGRKTNRRVEILILPKDGPIVTPNQK